MESVILSVWQVNNYVKEIFAEDAILSDITVSGEISGLKHHSSGHMYFTLKDERCAISAAMFKWQRQQLRFVPEDGMKVIARGKITLYEQTGQYQIVVSSMQPAGIGELYAAFEKLKQRLEAEGLFDPSRKKPLPQFPKKVGVVTSKTGAAVRDIINVIGRRYPLAEIVLCPVLVQGERAAEQIAAAVKQLDRNNACDVMIVGRGGGSIEDLWAFNDENLARTIAACRIPVISAVGHETDFTICDYVADLRAPTPSAAAELAVPDIEALDDSVQAMRERLRRSMESKMAFDSAWFRAVTSQRCFSSPLYGVERSAQQLDMLWSRVSSAFERGSGEREKRLAACSARLAAMNPFSVLARGYSIAEKDDKIITDAKSLRSGDGISVRFASGAADCTITKIYTED